MMSSSSWPGWLGSRCGHRERLADASRNQRNLQHVGVHGGDGEQADEAVLDGLVPGVLADHHDVGVGAVAQEAGNRGLRQHQQIVAVGQLRQHLLCAAGARRAGSSGRPMTARRSPGTADTPAARSSRRRASAAALRRPCGPGSGTGPPDRCRVRWPDRAASPVIARESIATWRASASTLGSRRRTSASALGSTELRQLDVDPRLVDALSGVAGFRSRAGCPAGPRSGLAPHPEHGVHDRHVRHAEPVQQHGHGVHQHRRVVGDDLQRRTESARVVGRVLPRRRVSPTLRCLPSL